MIELLTETRQMPFWFMMAYGTAMLLIGAAAGWASK